MTYQMKVGEIKVWFCREYKERFKKPYSWRKGHEDKVAKQLWQFFENEYKDKAPMYLYDSLQNYLDEKDVYYQDHEFWKFSQSCHRWISVKKKVKTQPPPVEEVIKKREVSPDKMSDEELGTWLTAVNNKGEPNGYSVIRGLAITKAKTANTSKMRTKMGDRCVEVFGLELCKEIASKARKGWGQQIPT